MDTLCCNVKIPILPTPFSRLSFPKHECLQCGAKEPEAIFHSLKHSFDFSSMMSKIFPMGLSPPTPHHSELSHKSTKRWKLWPYTSHSTMRRHNSKCQQEHFSFLGFDICTVLQKILSMVTIEDLLDGYIMLAILSNYIWSPGPY